ncbi:MAG: DUF4248 domain-containing protein [Bacteroidales bacterium]|nr:DUF4248 domain-containing protein [Candidatus Colimorpha merdihippi]
MTSYIFKYDLAQAYFPDVSPASAARLLNRELHHNPDLWQSLLDANYSPSQKRFTPLQVQIIYRYLGEP